MPIDSSIALGVKVPQIDTSGVVNALAHGRQMQMEQQRLQMQQTAAAEQTQLHNLTIQQHQQAQDDDKAARDLFANSPNATPEEVMAKLGPRVGAPIVKQMRDQETARLSVGKAKAEQMANIAGTMNDETSYHRGIDIGLQRGLIDQQQAATLHAQPWNEETQAHVKQLSLEATEAAKQHDMAIADAKEVHDAAMRPLEVKKLQGEVAEGGLKAATAQRQQDASDLAAAAKQGPDALAQAMSRLYAQDPKRFQAFRGLSAQAKPEDILAIGLTPDQQVTTGLTRERNAATKVNEEAMRKNAAGHLGIAQAELGIKQKTYDQTYGPNSNPALQGVEPRLRVAAAAGANKLGEAHDKATEAANNMKSIIDLAKSGNKIAYAYAPVTGVLTINTASGVKRVNMGEINAYGGAGSASDKLMGWLGKQTSGASIPPGILSNMEEMHSKIAENADANYVSSLERHNANYGSNFKPQNIKTNTNPAASGGAVPEVTNQADYDKLPKGAKYTNNGVPHVKQ